VAQPASTQRASRVEEHCGINFQPDLPLGLLTLALLASVELAKTARWLVLFGANHPPYRRCLQALVAGQITNALAPIRVGEAVRVSVLAARGDPLLLTVASVAGVKVVDAIGLALIAIVLVGTAAPPAAVWAMATGLVIGLGVAGLAWRAQAIRSWIVAKWAQRPGRVGSRVGTLLAGLRSAAGRRHSRPWAT
jgi:hypothetical protein